jgi:hypothetical protein
LKLKLEDYYKASPIRICRSYLLLSLKAQHVMKNMKYYPGKRMGLKVNMAAEVDTF